MTKIASISVALAVPLVVLAFWPLYLSRPFTAIDRYTHLHAATGVLWLALLIVQPATIHARRYTLHRVLGRISHPLAVLFCIAAVLLSHHRLVVMDEETFAAQGHTHYLSFQASILFVLAYGLGLWFRREPAVHGRFMLCTALPLIDPVIGRVMAFYLPPLSNLWLYQVVTFGLAAAIAALMVFTFRGVGSARWALRGYFTILIGLELGWFFVSPSSSWLQATRWFRGLSLS